MAKKQLKTAGQAEFYDNLCVIESNNFDNRIFWFNGGIIALSFMYFSTFELSNIILFIHGAILCCSAIFLILLGLNWASSYYAQMAAVFKDAEINNTYTEEIFDNIQNKIDKIPIINYFALFFSLAGAILIIANFILLKLS